MLSNKIFLVALHRAQPHDKYNAWAPPLLPDSQRMTSNHEAAMLCCDCSLSCSHILQRLTFYSIYSQCTHSTLHKHHSSSNKTLHLTDSQLGHSDFMIFWVVTVLLRLADEYNNLGVLGNNREDISSYYFKII